VTVVAITRLPQTKLAFAEEKIKMADDLEDAIRENAQGPAKAAGDSGSMEQHPLPDQIAADRYLESKKASRRKGLAIGLKRLVPPGTI
jgi:hypothetical protein